MKNNPRCHYCRERFTPKFSSLEKYCQEEECRKAEVAEKISKSKHKTVIVFSSPKLLSSVPKKSAKELLQVEINKLARLIDMKFGLIECIDCQKPFVQQEAGHFHPVSIWGSLRFNLHNIHSQGFVCNRDHIGGNKTESYYNGLIERYGLNYAVRVRYELRIQFKEIRFTEQELEEKLPIVRKLVRDFKTFQFTDSQQAREFLNNLIGIYKISS